MSRIDGAATVAGLCTSAHAAQPDGRLSACDLLPGVLEALSEAGYFIVTGVLDADFLAETRERMYAVQERIQRDVGPDRLQRAGEIGVLRLMMKYDSHFFRFLEIPEMLAVVDATVSPTAIMHLQNGFIRPSLAREEQSAAFQYQFHMDFPRVLAGYLMSINVMFAINTFTAANGGTIVVPRSHQKMVPPCRDDLERSGIPVECPAGSMVIFDSTLWHAAGQNVSGADRLAINHQFTRSWIKQQIDYVRALGAPAVEALPPRSQQLLGWYTRVVTSLDEYYVPQADRLYRKGQG